MKIKKILLSMLSVLVVLICLGFISTKAEAATVIESGKCGDSATYKIYDDATMVISGKGAINERAFRYNDGFSKLTIKNGITEIGNSAFYNCDYLVEVNIPKSVKKINGSAFRECDRLKRVSIENGLELIEDYAFYYCNSLTSINLPKSLKTIGKRSFELSGLTSISIPSGVTCIKDSAFSRTQVKNVVIPKNISNVPDGMFNCCYGLESVKIDKGVKTIGNNAFSYCKKLKTINFPSTITTIGIEAFIECQALEKVSLPNSITSIDESAFSYCIKLTDVNIPNKLTTLSNSVFRGCVGLTRIIISDSVKEIKGDAFSFCDNLKEVYLGEKVVFISSAFQYCPSLEKLIITNAKQSSILQVYSDAFYGSDSNKLKVYFVGTQTQLEDISWDFGVANSLSGSNRSYAEARLAKFTYEKATTEKDGKLNVVTIETNETVFTKPLKKISSIKLSETEYTYNGKAKKPSVTVKDSEGNVISSDYYSVKYSSGRKDVGEYTVTVTLKTRYSGSKKLTFTIIPKTTSKVTASQTTTTITASWKKVDGASGYKVYLYKGDDCVKSKTVNSKTLSYKFSDLKAGTAYTVKVKAYKTVDGEKIYSNNKTLKTATKPSTPSITSLKAGSKSVTIKWKNISGESGYQVYYATSKNGTYKKGADLKANDIDTTIKSLTKGKTYYFKVRAYKNTDSGKVYSSWSSIKSVKVK